MLTVHKYPAKVDDYFTILLPVNAKILTVQIQNGEPFVWALVDTEVEYSGHRKFRLVGTGHPIGHERDDLKYVGTFQMEGGSLVFHLFELCN